MTREEQIRQVAEKYSDNTSHYVEWGDGWTDYNDIEYVENAFIAGAKWADEHPKKDVYRDANGDIISLEELERRYKQGIEYRKQKLIDKVCNWISNSRQNLKDLDTETYIQMLRKIME